MVVMAATTKAICCLFCTKIHECKKVYINVNECTSRVYTVHCTSCVLCHIILFLCDDDLFFDVMVIVHTEYGGSYWFAQATTVRSTALSFDELIIINRSHSHLSVVSLCCLSPSNLQYICQTVNQ